MSTTSLSLLNRASAGDDSQSWTRLSNIYQPLLYRWVSAFGIQHTDAEDLTQEVLAVVFKELPAFQHNERTGAFRKWLRNILINRVRPFLRSRKTGPVATANTEMMQQLADDRSDISRIWDREHDAHVVSRLTELVKSRFESQTWNAFSRQVIDGISPIQVADELNMSLSNVYVAKSRVLRVLRQEAGELVD